MPDIVCKIAETKLNSIISENLLLLDNYYRGLNQSSQVWTGLDFVVAMVTFIAPLTSNSSSITSSLGWGWVAGGIFISVLAPPFSFTFFIGLLLCVTWCLLAWGGVGGLFSWSSPSLRQTVSWAANQKVKPQLRLSGFNSGSHSKSLLPGASWVTTSTLVFFICKMGFEIRKNSSN